MVQVHTSHAVSTVKRSMPSVMLHFEGLAVFTAAIALYIRGDYGGYG